jgi:uncharacterized membrane protein
MDIPVTENPAAIKVGPRVYFIAAWVLAIFYTSYSVISSVWPIPGIGVPITALVPLVFALVHGSVMYGWRGILMFLVISLVVSNAFENLSILSGFPFGHYHYTDGLGAHLFNVPLLIGPVYFGVGYLSWALARSILGDRDARLRGPLALTVPMIASFIMVSWDLTMDPGMATLQHNWIWHDGGRYFGVPVSNFLGWYLTVFVFYQLFALFVRWTADKAPPAPLAARKWLAPAIVCYLSIPFRPVLNLASDAGAQTVADTTGVVWRVADISAVTGLVALFTLVPFTLLALAKLAQTPDTA